MTGSILVNGRPEALSESKLDELLTRLGYETSRRGIAVAVNGRVVPRSEWSARSVEDGDEIDIVIPVQGG